MGDLTATLGLRGNRGVDIEATSGGVVLVYEPEVRGTDIHGRFLDTQGQIGGHFALTWGRMYWPRVAVHGETVYVGAQVQVEVSSDVPYGWIGVVGEVRGAGAIWLESTWVARDRSVGLHGSLRAFNQDPLISQGIGPHLPQSGFVPVDDLWRLSRVMRVTDIAIDANGEQWWIGEGEAGTMVRTPDGEYALTPMRGDGFEPKGCFDRNGVLWLAAGAASAGQIDAQGREIGGLIRVTRATADELEYTDMGQRSVGIDWYTTNGTAPGVIVAQGKAEGVARVFKRIRPVGTETWLEEPWFPGYPVQFSVTEPGMYEIGLRGESDGLPDVVTGQKRTVTLMKPDAPVVPPLADAIWQWERGAQSLTTDVITSLSILGDTSRALYFGDYLSRVIAGETPEQALATVRAAWLQRMSQHILMLGEGSQS